MTAAPVLDPTGTELTILTLTCSQEEETCVDAYFTS